MRVSTYLNFPGNAEEAMEFYRSVFGGEFFRLTRFKDMPIPGVELPVESQDKIMHVSLEITPEHLLMASDSIESMGQSLTTGNNVHISLHPESKEEADRLFTALSEGGKVGMPLEDQMWGDYYGHFTDKFGINWMVNFSYPQMTSKQAS
jgi:PhnB protein